MNNSVCDPTTTPKISEALRAHQTPPHACVLGPNPPRRLSCCGPKTGTQPLSLDSQAYRGRVARKSTTS